MLTSTGVVPQASWSLGLLTPMLWNKPEIFVHQTNALSFSRHHFIHGGKAMLQ
jgi:hypothetical protein